jgi:hypothetical protein
MHFNITSLFVGMVSALDEAVGNITGALEANGFMDNAVIVFTTDVSITSYGRTNEIGFLQNQTEISF